MEPLGTDAISFYCKSTWPIQEIVETAKIMNSQVNNNISALMINKGMKDIRLNKKTLRFIFRGKVVILINRAQYP